MCTIEKKLGLFYEGLTITVHSSEEPDIVSQEEIQAKMDPAEAARLSRVRNIGIAVRSSYSILRRW